MKQCRLLLAIGLSISSIGFARTKPQPPDNVDITRDNISQHLEYGNKLVEYYDVIHNCKVKTNILGYELRATKERWLGAPQTDGLKMFIHSTGKDYRYNTNLFDNLKSLQEDHSKYHEVLDQFAKGFEEPVNPEFGFYEDSLKKLDNESKPILSESRKLGVAESKFFGSLEHLSWSLKNLGEYYKDDIAFIKSSECEEAGIATYLEHINWNIGNLQATIQELYNFAANLRNKRNLLTTYAYTAVKTKLLNGYDRLIVNRASDLHDRLRQTLEFFKLEREVFEWRFGLSRRLGNSAYLQFEHPLRQRRAEREAAAQFLNRVAEYPNALGKDNLIRTLNTLIAFLDDEIETYQSKGWEGLFERQKVIVGAYIGHLDVIRDECAPLLKSFRDEQAQIASIDQFRSVERLFMEIVDVCQLKEAE